MAETRQLREMIATPNKRIVAVVGGTGNLGGSVARSLYDNPEFHVRILSRHPDSPKAKPFIEHGFEVVQANCWNHDELAAAFKGCWGLFMNTDSDTPEFMSRMKSEFDMGKLVIDTAVEQGIKHFVYASLPKATELTHGRLPVLSFDSKANIQKYAESHKGFDTVAIVSSGWHLENQFTHKYAEAFGGFALYPDSEGYLSMHVPPMGNDPELVPWLACADDYGDFVHGVFLDPVAWNRAYIHAVSESLSFQDMTQAYSRATGREARHHVLNPGDTLSAFDENKTREVNNLFALMHALGGWYFNGEVTDPAKGIFLKAQAAKARGRSSVDAIPMTADQFFQKYTS